MQVLYLLTCVAWVSSSSHTKYFFVDTRPTDSRGGILAADGHLAIHGDDNFENTEQTKM